MFHPRKKLVRLHDEVWYSRARAKPANLCKFQHDLKSKNLSLKEVSDLLLINEADIGIPPATNLVWEINFDKKLEKGMLLLDHEVASRLHLPSRFYMRGLA